MFLACATDRHFVELTGVMLRSFSVNAKMPDAKIIVFDDNLRPKDREAIRASAVPHAVRFVSLDVARPLIGHLKTARHWPISNYVRLIVPEIIEDSGRLLFVDCDVVVNAGLQDLFVMNLAGHALAAVPTDDTEWRVAFNRRFGRPDQFEAFNAGVLLFDLDEWRRRSLTQDILHWIAENQDEIVGFSQDPANMVLGQDWAHMPKTYNFQGRKMRNTDEFSDAHIIHFTGTIKPNYAECNHPAREVYLRHRRSTPWSDRSLVSRHRRKFGRFMFNLRARMKSLVGGKASS